MQNFKVIGLFNFVLYLNIRTIGYFQYMFTDTCNYLHVTCDCIKVYKLCIT